MFGNDRSKRYALVTEDGKVKEVHVEPDNTGVDGMGVFSYFFVVLGCLTAVVRRTVFPTLVFDLIV